MVINVNEELRKLSKFNLQVVHFGARRPAGAFVGCDLSQPAYIEFMVDVMRYRSPRTKAVTSHRTPKIYRLMQVTAGCAGEEGDSVLENGCDDGEAFTDSFR